MSEPTTTDLPWPRQTYSGEAHEIVEHHGGHVLAIAEMLVEMRRLAADFEQKYEEQRARADRAVAANAAMHAVIEHVRKARTGYYEDGGEALHVIEVDLTALDAVPLADQGARVLAELDELRKIKAAARAMLTKYGNGPARAESELRGLLGLNGGAQ